MSRLRHAYRALVWSATVLAGISVVLLMALTCVSAITRYTLGHPVGGAYEITTLYLMPAAVWLGMASAEESAAHIRVTAIAKRLPRSVSAVAQTISACCVAVLASSTVLGVISHWGLVLGGAVRLPVGPSRLVVTIGATLLALVMLVGIWRAKSRLHDAADGEI